MDEEEQVEERQGTADAGEVAAGIGAACGAPGTEATAIGDDGGYYLMLSMARMLGIRSKGPSNDQWFSGLGVSRGQYEALAGNARALGRLCRNPLLAEYLPARQRDVEALIPYMDDVESHAEWFDVTPQDDAAPERRAMNVIARALFLHSGVPTPLWDGGEDTFPIRGRFDTLDALTPVALRQLAGMRNGHTWYEDVWRDGVRFLTIMSARLVSMGMGRYVPTLLAVCSELSRTPCPVGDDDKAPTKPVYGHPRRRDHDAGLLPRFAYGPAAERECLREDLFGMEPRGMTERVYAGREGRDLFDDRMGQIASVLRSSVDVDTNEPVELSVQDAMPGILALPFMADDDGAVPRQIG